MWPPGLLPASGSQSATLVPFSAGDVSAPARLRLRGKTHRWKSSNRTPPQRARRPVESPGELSVLTTTRALATTYGKGTVCQALSRSLQHCS